MSLFHAFLCPITLTQLHMLHVLTIPHTCVQNGGLDRDLSSLLMATVSLFLNVIFFLFLFPSLVCVYILLLFFFFFYSFFFIFLFFFFCHYYYYYLSSISSLGILNIKYRLPFKDREANLFRSRKNDNEYLNLTF